MTKNTRIYSRLHQDIIKNFEFLTVFRLMVNFLRRAIRVLRLGHRLGVER